MGHIVMRRRPDWRARFDREVDRLRRAAFVWGENDCAVGLAGNLSLALTGVDSAAAYRGAYTSEIGALRILRAGGFATLGDLIATLAPEYDHPSRARIGDVGAVPVPGPFGHALAVVDYERLFVLTETGFGTLDRSAMVRAYKIG
ncbi:DUF6950 family protein [Phaeovulum sp. W22_SRMD_FR3]|uniref:DUF6950 family protein n=1 Tax=Phaeovulum sp. W22_SRMD_FR3 TaxID=3240274 RepID=UPI003F9C2631